MFIKKLFIHNKNIYLRYKHIYIYLQDKYLLIKCFIWTINQIARDRHYDGKLELFYMKSSCSLISILIDNKNVY